ncbi:MAG: hypothetical protein ABI792_01910 [bacterium]
MKRMDVYSSAAIEILSSAVSYSFGSPCHNLFISSLIPKGLNINNTA